jgi:hypothetical protein
VFLTLAVAFILMTTGLGPQEKRMIPPARTAATTAAEVQLAAVPRPTTWFARDVFTARPAEGTGTERTPAADRRGAELAVDATQAQTTSRPRSAIRIDVRRDMGQA